MAETGLTKAQLEGKENVPVHEGAGRKPFVLGQPLMWPKLIDRLPMRMRELHNWYLKYSSGGNIMFVARIKDSHFHRSMDDVWIELVNCGIYTINLL